MSKKRVLVTGATGFIGRHALQPLIERAFEVHAVFHETPLQINDVTWHQADLLKEGSAEALCSEVRATHLLHFAWIATPGVYWTSSENEKWKQATLDLLKAFSQCGGKRAALAGTCAEYDWSEGAGVFSENSRIDPASPYGKAKHETHQRAAFFAREQALSLAWGRIFFLYGPGEPKERLVPSVIRALLNDEAARTTSGEQVRDFLYVHDVADAFVSLLESTAEGAVNIGSGEGIAIRDIILQVAETLGKRDLVQLGALPKRDEPARIVADITRLRNEVDWIPLTSLKKGLDETIAWWKANRA